MKNELIIIDSLNQESDKISHISNPSFHKFRHSVPSYDLSGWNEETPPINPKDLQHKSDLKHYKDPKDPKDSKDPKISHLSQRSQPQSSECLIHKNLNPAEAVPSRRRSCLAIKKSLTPAIYKVHKIFFEQANLPCAHRPARPIEKPLNLITKRKSNFLKKQASAVSEAKDLTDLEELLKPEAKHPVTSAVEPRLQSRSEQYRSSHIRHKKQRLNFACLDFRPFRPFKPCEPLEPLHVSSKCLNPN